MVSAVLLLVIALVSHITKGSLNNSLDPLGPTSTVMEQHSPSLLVTTLRKLVPLREIRLVSSSSASLEFFSIQLPLSLTFKVEVDHTTKEGLVPVFLQNTPNGRPPGGMFH